jgi:NADH:ubiquinone reductase (H+-translocating)
MSSPHRVVIVGGGFGGLNAARALRRSPVEITLIDKRNFHLFQPLLYQVASGALSPGDISAPLRSVLARQPNTRVLMGHVTGFDPAGRKVLLGGGDQVPYDTLVVAAGAENQYFGNDHWTGHAPGLKTVEDATEIRRRIFTAFERAERETDPDARRAWLRFVVVGGGPTGVELAGALAEISRDTLRHDFRSIRTAMSEILLVEGSDRVLTPFHSTLSGHAERSLIRLGVRARTGVRVVGIDREGLDVETHSGRERIVARTVLWAAGVRGAGLGSALAEAAGLKTERGNRVRVGPDLTLPGHPEIFVIGDMAWCEQNGQPLPGVAPVAMQQGHYIARAIDGRVRGRPVGPFRYIDKGNMAVIGRAHGIAEIGRLRFHGWVGWLFWLFVHLMYLVGFQNRLLVFIKWGFMYLTFNRGARLITGEKPEP